MMTPMLTTGQPPAALRPLTRVCRFMCSRRVNFFPQISQG